MIVWRELCPLLGKYAAPGGRFGTADPGPLHHSPLFSVVLPESFGFVGGVPARSHMRIAPSITQPKQIPPGGLPPSGGPGLMLVHNRPEALGNGGPGPGSLHLAIISRSRRSQQPVTKVTREDAEPFAIVQATWKFPPRSDLLRRMRSNPEQRSTVAIPRRPSTSDETSSNRAYQLRRITQTLY